MRFRFGVQHISIDSSLGEYLGWFRILLFVNDATKKMKD